MEFICMDEDGRFGREQSCRIWNWLTEHVARTFYGADDGVMHLVVAF